MVKYLTQDEERRLLEAVKGRYAKRDRLILPLAVNTGLRVSELCALTLFDVMNGKIKNELEVRKEVAKGKRARVIPLNSRAKKAIGELLAWNEARSLKQGPGTRLLRSQKGKAMTRQQVGRIIRCAGERAKLDLEASPHTLRHTFATRVYAKTNNLRVVQKLLGHSSVSTTQIYADVTREQLRLTVNAL